MSFFQHSYKFDKLNIDLSVKTTTMDMPLLPVLATSPEAVFLRVGNDLVIKIPGDSGLIRDYFVNPVPLKTVEGMILSVEDITAVLSHDTKPILLATHDTADLITPLKLTKIGLITATVEGPITAQSEDGTIRTLNMDDPVYLHDTIMTAVRSYVKIILNDGTVFQLGPHSRASLDKYAYDPKHHEISEFESYITSGSFRYISGKIGGVNLGQHTVIKTPSAHIGIRGSEVDGIIGEDGSTTVLHLSGLVSIMSLYRSEEITVFERGMSVYIPSENLSHTIEQRTETHIQQRNQAWQVFKRSGSAEENTFGLMAAPSPNDTPVGDENTTPDDGAQNPFSTATVDVHSDESVDDIVSENLEEQAEQSIEEQAKQEPPVEDIEVPSIEVENISTEKEATTSESLNEVTEITEITHPFKEPLPKDDDTSKPDDKKPPSDKVLELTLNEDSAQIIEVAEDTDKITQIVQPRHGEIVDNGDGTFTYTPAAHFNGEDYFTYTLNGTETVLVELTVTSINDAPVAKEDIRTIEEDTPLVLRPVDLLENDEEIDEGDSLAIVNVESQVVRDSEGLIINDLTQGTVSLNDSGSIVYLPAPDFNGQAEFIYTTQDSHGARDTARVVVNVIPVNDAPVATDDFITFGSREELNISFESLLENDLDVEGDIPFIVRIENPENGQLNLLDSGEMEFLIDDGFTTAGFDYIISDGRLTDVGHVTMARTNFPPTAVNDENTTPKNKPMVLAFSLLLANDSEPNIGDTFTLTEVKNAIHGDVRLEGADKVIFTPQPDFVGNGSFEYVVTDNQGASATAQVNIAITNAPPVAANDPEPSNAALFNTLVDTPLTILAASLLANDSDPDGDNLEVVRVEAANNGTVELKDEQVTFTPAKDFTGEASFEYTIKDSSDAQATATVAVIVTPANLPPVITLPNSGTPLVYNATDAPLPIDSAATVTDSDSPHFENGTLRVAITANRTPNDRLEIGSEPSGQIKVSNSTGGDIFFGDTPIGYFLTTVATGALLINLNANADDVATTALLQAIDYRNISATPLTDIRTVEMTLTDGDGGISEVASRDIEITTTHLPPDAVDDNVAKPFNTPTTIPVSELLANDSNVNPAEILKISELSNLSDGVNAKLVSNEVQLFIDALVSDNFDAVTFDYTVTDGDGGEDTATVTITPTNVKRGTSGDDTLEGTDDVEIILGDAGNDTFAPSVGSDILLGGDNDDLFLFNPDTAAGVHINGNNGTDTLSLFGTDNQVFDLIKNRNLPTEQQFALQGIEKIDISGNSNQLRLSIEDVLDISDSNRLVIDGDASSTVNSVGQGWSSEGVDSSGLYHRYTSTEAELLVSVDITSQFIS